MDPITIFNIISGACSIAGLLISIFVANKVYKINQNMDIDKSTHQKVNQKIKGNNNKQSGGNMRE